MTEWKHGDMCRVKRSKGRGWHDGRVFAVLGGRVRVMIENGGDLVWAQPDSVCRRPAPRGKLPEPKERPALTTEEAASVLSVFLQPRPAALKPVPKPTTARDSSYLAHVRRHPCCSCGTTEAIHAHHVAGGGMGAKCSDYLTAPLCGVDHGHWHSTGTLPGMSREQSLATLWESAAKILEEWVRELGR